MFIAHSLIIRNPRRSLDFYQHILGMEMVSHQLNGEGIEEIHSYQLRFPNNLQAGLLELQFYPQRNFQRQDQVDGLDVGYWKIGITTANVDLAAAYLQKHGIDVSKPQQFLDVGYMAHLRDPDGYLIELLQNELPIDNSSLNKPNEFAKQSTFAHVSLRVANPEKSLNFYCQGLGMKLLSRQFIEQHDFTLYFLAFTQENPPVDDIDAVSNRLWLWQRPYPVLELQFFHARSGGYSASAASGFSGLRVQIDKFSEVKSNLEMVRNDSDPATREYDFAIKKDVYKLFDPDGYSVRICSSELQ